MKSSLTFLILLVTISSVAQRTGRDYSSVSEGGWLQTQKRLALQIIDTRAQALEQSRYYPMVSPHTLVGQLRERVMNPYALDQGKTCFCWAAVPIAFMYDQEPVEMVNAVLSLYTKGSFRFYNGKSMVCLPSRRDSRRHVGSSLFRAHYDSLAGRLVDQMVFMVFADNYKCLANIDRHFDPGDQNRMEWAGGPLSKERKVWQDLDYTMEKRGFNMVWLKKNKAEALQQALASEHTVILFVNGARFNRNWARLREIRRKPPFIVTGSHYILVNSFEQLPEGYRITFWDDDGMQTTTLPQQLFNRSVYAVATVNKKDRPAKCNWPAPALARENNLMQLAPNGKSTQMYSPWVTAIQHLQSTFRSPS